MPTWQVGKVRSSYLPATWPVTLLAGWVIKRLGFNRSYYLASLIFAVGCVGLGITVGFWTWLSWRFIAGVGCAMTGWWWKSALVCSGTSRSRGRLLAAYMMVYYVGTVLGQLMVKITHRFNERPAVGDRPGAGGDPAVAVYPHYGAGRRAA